MNKRRKFIISSLSGLALATLPRLTYASSSNPDVVVIGAGAAGLFCASLAGKRGLNTLVLDNGKKLGRKILRHLHPE